MLGMVGIGGVSGGGASGGFGVPNNVYGVVLSDSTINIAADTFDLTADGTGIVFATQSVNQMPGQPIQYAATAYQKVAAVTSISTIGVAATPVFSPPGGAYGGTQTVSMLCATPGVAIYYTTDGSVPTSGSTHYTTPISVTLPKTLNAIAILSGYTNSQIGTAIYLAT